MGTLEGKHSAWDTFCLTLRIESPLDVVFTRKALEQYHRFFQFLWQLRRTEFELQSAWERQMSARRQLDLMTQNTTALGRVLHRCQVWCAEMQHFVRKLHHYLMVE